jgi:hypothetical protein
MCGPSALEKGEQGNISLFENMLRSNYGELFSEQQGVLNALNQSLSPTVAKGPSQQGFAAPELAALQTQAINNAGAANTAAQQAARTYGAGQGGGGTSGLTSGITKQIQSAIASQEAGTLGTNLNQINMADWQQGNANYNRAIGAMSNLGSMYNPSGAMSGTLQANQAAFGQANQMNQESNAMGRDIAGFLTAAAGGAADIIKG